MTKERRRDLANAMRDALLSAYGWQCAECGSGKRLEIDHPFGRDWQPRTVNRYARFKRYMKEHHEGRIRVLCRKCNGRLGAIAQHAGHDAESGDPF